MHIRLSIGAVAVLASGCATVPDNQVQFGNLSDCPQQSASVLNSKQNTLGSASTTHELECALTTLRDTQDPSLLRTPLGSRIALHLAERNTHPQQRESLANEGVRFADKALALGGAGDGAVHYYLAANLGLAVHDHPVEAASNLQRLEREMQQAVKLNRDIDEGGPLRLLGMLYLKAPPWPTGIGDGDKALDLLKQAVDKHPAHPLNHLFHAQALWEVEGQDAASQAKAEFATGLDKLSSGNWGYNKQPWTKEFDKLAREIGAPAS